MGGGGRRGRPWWLVGLAMVLVTVMAILAELESQDFGPALKMTATAIVAGLAGYRIRG